MNASEPDRRPGAWWLLVPGLGSILLMLPRLTSAQFGLFDDAHVLVVADRILAGDWLASVEASGGQFRPLYWLYYAVVKAIVGLSPGGFFLGNALLFFAAVVLLGCVVRLVARSTGLALLAQTLFLFSGPVVENVYTLSKPELLQVCWIGLALGAAALASRSASPGRRVGYAALSALGVASAALTKETGVLLAPIGLLWAVRAEVARRRQPPGTGRMGRRVFLASAVGGAVLALGLQTWAGSLANLPQGYASGFSLTNADLIRTNVGIWADWLLRDYLYLGVLGVAALAATAARRAWVEVGLLVDCLIWMGVWLAVYLPWQFTPEYYLLPLAMGAAGFGAVSIGILVRLARQASTLPRLVAWPTLAVALLFFATTLPNNLTNARVQLAVDRANGELLAYATGRLPIGSLLVINIQEPNEYVTHFPTWVQQLLGRPDITVDTFRGEDPVPAGGADRPVFIASPVVENQFYPSVRLGVYESTARAWSRLPGGVRRRATGGSVSNPLQVSLPGDRRQLCLVPDHPGLRLLPAPGNAGRHPALRLRLDPVLVRIRPPPRKPGLASIGQEDASRPCLAAAGLGAGRCQPAVKSSTEPSGIMPRSHSFFEDPMEVPYECC